MSRKTFIGIAIALIVAFSFSYAVKYMKPVPRQVRDLNEFPIQYDGWYGKVEHMGKAAIDMLDPDLYFNAAYYNKAGNQIQLFFDYFSQGSTSGGVHSPHNCLPGSGWTIYGSQPRQININGRIISGSRLFLRLGESKQVMDYWYVTRYGETANDYTFKLYTMLSSLTLNPTDVGFIRFVALDNPESLIALEQFEKSFVPVIYGFLPFDQ